MKAKRNGAPLQVYDGQKLIGEIEDFGEEAPTEIFGDDTQAPTLTPNGGGTLQPLTPIGRAPMPMAASPMIQNKIGAASATVESAFTLLLTSVAAAEDKVRNDTPLAIGERIAIRRNQGFAAKQSVSVVNDLFAKEGAAGSDLAAPLQRFWRDANAAALHLSLDWEPIAAMYGQERLGLEPVGLY